jgi:DmsE family decaheme c-type cytochrome
MFAAGIQIAAALGALVVLASGGEHISGQFDDLAGMDVPEDVTGADCTMCHGQAATEFEFKHPPAANAECATCHEETGVGGHGALKADDRSLCLSCHQEKETHYPALNCWTSSCHSDTHGSNVDEFLNPSRKEAYPGFYASTEGADYVGTDTCLECHGNYCESWSESMHSMMDGDSSKSPAMQGCESCHGPGGNHWGRGAGIGDFMQATTAEADDACLKCHKDESYVPDYKRGTHVKHGVACISCHNPHDQTNKHNLKNNPNGLCLDCHQTKRIDFAKLSHHPLDSADPTSGMQCVDCHNPHGGEGREMLVAPKEELCFMCHSDKQGPFIYSHAGYDPAMGRGCATCHDNHGSNSPNLLKMSGRGLCLQCHNDRTTHFPTQTCWTTGCHSDHHGSNQDFYFFNK